MYDSCIHIYIYACIYERSNLLIMYVFVAIGNVLITCMLSCMKVLSINEYYFAWSHIIVALPVKNYLMKNFQYMNTIFVWYHIIVTLTEKLLTNVLSMFEYHFCLKPCCISLARKIYLMQVISIYEYHFCMKSYHNTLAWKILDDSNFNIWILFFKVIS